MLVTQALILALAVWPIEGFTPVVDVGDVHVFQRATGGHAIELAAEGVFAAPPEQVRRVLIDYARHTRWVANLAESTVLATTLDSLDVYQRLGLPVIKDRDYSLHVTWGAEAESLWLRFAAANERGPGPRSGVVRVAVHEGEWRFDPVDGGRATRARYRFRLDLAGSVPAWMGRGRAARDVPALFDAIRRQLPSYR